MLEWRVLELEIYTFEEISSKIEKVAASMGTGSGCGGSTCVGYGCKFTF